MLREVFSAARQRIRATFFLGPAPPGAAFADAAAVQAKVQAARLRRKAAQRLLERGETVPALVLYRDASGLLLPSLNELLDREQLPTPPELELHAALLASTDSELFDGLSSTAGVSTAADLDRVVDWAIRVLDRPTPEQRRVQRRIRLSALGLVVLLASAAGVAWFRRLPNLALGRPAAASSVAFGATPDKAVDGIRYGALGFHSGGPGADWWSVDLGRAYALERVEAYGRADCCFDQSVPLGFEVSLDGKKYRRVAQRTEAFRQSDPWVIPGEGVVARFIRFRTLRKTYLVLSEVEVYGRPRAAR
jgi:hypothetical protein